MGDEWFPSGTPMFEPFLRNFVDNPIVVQFVHRWLAFAVAAMAAILAAEAWRRRFHGAAIAVAGAALVQILLGIATLMSGLDIHIAVAHTAMAALPLPSLLPSHPPHRAPRPARRTGCPA